MLKVKFFLCTFNFKDLHKIDNSFKIWVFIIKSPFLFGPIIIDSSIVSIGGFENARI